jgi:hypothetical protein
MTEVAYSSNCVENEFYELRLDGVLRSLCLPEELEEDYPDRHGKVEDG